MIMLVSGTAAAAAAAAANRSTGTSSTPIDEIRCSIYEAVVSVSVHSET